VLVGPALIRTTITADSRAEEVRRELAVVERDLARSVSALRPRRARLDEIAGELAELAEAIEGADARITHAAERIARIDGELSSVGEQEEILTQRLAGMDDAAAAWRENLAAAEHLTHELPQLPKTPEPPIQARVAVETLRRERDRIQTRLSSVRSERETSRPRTPTRCSPGPTMRRARVARRSIDWPPPRRRWRRGPRHARPRRPPSGRPPTTRRS
jgi:chromosome segregation ATPase